MRLKSSSPIGRKKRPLGRKDPQDSPGVVEAPNEASKVFDFSYASGAVIWTVPGRIRPHFLSSHLTVAKLSISAAVPAS
jgi:hypothetical protein